MKKNSIYYFYSLFCISLITLIAGIFFCNNDVRGVESNVIHSIQRMLVNKSNLYQNPSDIPFNISQYSPLYYIICQKAITLLPIDAHEYFKIRVITKIISNIFLFLTVLTLFKFNKKHLGLSNTINFYISSLLIIFTFPWNSISRPDVMVLFFVMTFLFQVADYIKTGNIKHCFFAGIIIALAIFSKLNGVLLIIILFPYLIIIKKWKEIFGAIAGIIIGCSSLLLIMYFENYHLIYIYDNVVNGIKNGSSFIDAYARSFNPFISTYLVFILFISFLVAKHHQSIFQIKLNGLMFFITFCAVICFVFSAITSLKIGSGVNYFNEFILVILVFSTMLISSYEVNHKKYFTLLLLTGISVSIVHLYNYSIPIKNNISWSRGFKNDEQMVIKFLQNEVDKSQYFYSDQREISLALPEKCTLFPVDIHTTTYPLGIYNYSKVRHSFSNGNIKYLVFFNKFKPILGWDFSSNYILKKSFGQYLIYEFNNNSASIVN